MSKLTRTIVSTPFFVIGATIIFFTSSALLKASDWITIAIYSSVAIVGLAFMAIGWAVIRGKDVKEMFRDLFSGISF